MMDPFFLSLARTTRNAMHGTRPYQPFSQIRHVPLTHDEPYTHVSSTKRFGEEMNMIQSAANNSVVSRHSR
jgi:hypothetical protein